jgi:hypothetical protein
MTDALALPVRSGRTLMPHVCQGALWFLIAVKALWLALALASLGTQSPIPVFAGAFVVLLAATLAFQMSKSEVAVGLSLTGVVLGYVAGRSSGVQPGPMTDRLHEQFLSHWADLAFLTLAVLLFFLLRNTSQSAASSDAR